MPPASRTDQPSTTRSRHRRREGLVVIAIVFFTSFAMYYLWQQVLG
jgi:hypothetical protein